MATRLFRSSALFRGTANPRVAIKSVSGVATTSFVRGKATLPDLPYDYGALEPHISGKIMELHHKGHHQTYVNGLNQALEQISEAHARNDEKAAAAVAPLLNFHGGGHMNHSLFWENLSPSSKNGGGEPVGELAKHISQTFGGFQAFQKKMNTTLAGIQGSGWAWLVQDGPGGGLSIITRANQDPVTGSYIPLLGIDAWEHAYYLQYQNRKAEYFNAIWNVINWETVARRMNTRLPGQDSSDNSGPPTGGSSTTTDAATKAGFFAWIVASCLG